MSWGIVAGAAITAVGSAVSANQKKTPTAVQQQPLDWQAEQKKALEGNLATLPGAQNLSAQTNTFNQSESNRLMESALPGWSKLQSSMMGTAQGLLTNPYELDADTQQYIARKAAERGISAGTRGQFSDFSYLKDFGISSMNAASQKINQAQGIMGLLASTAPRVNPMSPMSMFVTPTQIAQSQQQQNIANQAIGQGAANAQAANSNYQNQQVWNGVGSVVGSVDWGKMFGSSSTSTSSSGYVNPTTGVPIK